MRVYARASTALGRRDRRQSNTRLMKASGHARSD